MTDAPDPLATLARARAELADARDQQVARWLGSHAAMLWSHGPIRFPDEHEHEDGSDETRITSRYALYPRDFVGLPSWEGASEADFPRMEAVMTVRTGEM